MSSQSKKGKVTRDVKMVFDIFVETLQGGVPGQGYVAKFWRGENTSGNSPIVRASSAGVAEFKYRAQFTCTLQRKNDFAYKKKEFRLHVEESPGGFIIADVVYDLAEAVDHEMFPNKKLMTRSADGRARLLFSISGMSEADQLKHLAAIRQSAKYQQQQQQQDPSDEQGAPLSSQQSISREVSMSYQRDDDEAESPMMSRRDTVLERSQSMANSSSVLPPSQPRPENVPPAPQQTQSQQLPQEQKTDDDYGALVDSAVFSSMRDPTPPVSATRRKGTPRSEQQIQPAQQQQTQLQLDQPRAVAATKDPAPAPAEQGEDEDEFLAAFSKKKGNSTASASMTAVKESSAPAVRPPPAQYSSGEPKLPPSALRKTSSEPPVALSAVAASSSSSTENAAPSFTRTEQQPSRAASEAAREPSPKDTRGVYSSAKSVERPSRQASVATSAAAGSNSYRSPGDDQVQVYLNEIIANVTAAATQQGGNSTQQRASKGYDFIPNTNTSSAIPRAALLVLHCLKRWRGAQRTAFLHDFVSVLFTEVIPTSRHGGAWINTLLHVLYHTLSHTDGDDGDYDDLSDGESQEIADRFLSIASLVGTESKNTFLVRGSRTDALFRLLPQELSDSVSMPPAATVILAVALDESLRQLTEIITTPLLRDIARFCFPPKTAPSRNTENGYHYIPSASSIGGGGAEHPTDDPAFSVLLHSLETFHAALFGYEGPEAATSSAALMRVTCVEIFRLVFRNLAAYLVNNLWYAPEGAVKPTDATFRVVTARSALHLKLAVSMLEHWLEQHHLFTAVRPELLPCRQFCDLAILQKKLLLNPECREEATSSLPPLVVLTFLQQYQPNPRDYVVDDVPKDVLSYFEKQVDAQKRKRAKADQSSVLPRLSTPPISSFDFLQFIASLLPPESDEGAGQDRKSLRRSIGAAAQQISRSGDGPSPNLQFASNKRALDWDYDQGALKDKSSRESIFTGYVAATGDGLTEEASEQARERVALRLAALSLPDEEVIDNIRVL